MSDEKDKSRQPGTDREVPLEAVRHPETLYDRSDLTARGIVYFMIALAITVVIIHLITWGFMRYFTGNQVTPAPRNAAIVTPAQQAKGDPAQRFPAPQLQPDPVADLDKFRGALEQQLNSSGVDQKSGAAHIPIEQAIDMISKNGLPVRPQPALPPRANFGSGDGSVAGAGAGTEPRANQ